MHSGQTQAKCLVLGGVGFLGLHLIKQLNSLGHQVRVFDHSAGRKENSEWEWISGEFSDAEQVDRAVAGCEVVFHLISTTLPKTSNENPQQDVRTNVMDTISLLDAARKHGVAKVIFISSGGTVYGVPERLPIDESHPTNPICSYGITKLAIEKYLHLYKVLYGLDYSVLRVANLYGEGQRVGGSQGVVPAFMNRAMERKPVEIWGNGSIIRDYLYVSDAVNAITAAAFLNASSARVFNIGSGQGTSLLQMIAAIENVTKLEIDVRLKPARPFDIPVNVLNISRARAELDWSPRVSLEEGLQRMFDWVLAGQES